MGIDIHSAVVYGFSVNKKQVNEIHKLGWSPDRWVMELTERMVHEMSIAMAKSHLESDGHCHFSRRLLYHVEHYFYYIGDYLKRKPNGNLLQPLEPFWSEYCQDRLEDLYEYGVDQAAIDYQSQFTKDSKPRIMETASKITWPDECQPDDVFGMIHEQNFGRETDRAAAMHHYGNGNRTIQLQGTLPWETGVAYDKDRVHWHIFNGQNLLTNQEWEKVNKTTSLADMGLLFPTKEDAIKHQKDLWDQYSERYPFRTYPGHGWRGCDIPFDGVRALYQMASELIPSIKYDILNLHKYLAYWWC